MNRRRLLGGLFASPLALVPGIAGAEQYPELDYLDEKFMRAYCAARLHQMYVAPPREIKKGIWHKGIATFPDGSQQEMGLWDFLDAASD